MSRPASTDLRGPGRVQCQRGDGQEPGGSAAGRSGRSGAGIGRASVGAPVPRAELSRGGFRGPRVRGGELRQGRPGTGQSSAAALRPVPGRHLRRRHLRGQYRHLRGQYRHLRRRCRHLRRRHLRGQYRHLRGRYLRRPAPRSGARPCLAASNSDGVPASGSPSPPPPDQRPQPRRAHNSRLRRRCRTPSQGPLFSGLIVGLAFWRPDRAGRRSGALREGGRLAGLVWPGDRTRSFLVLGPARQRDRGPGADLVCRNLGRHRHRAGR